MKYLIIILLSFFCIEVFSQSVKEAEKGRIEIHLGYTVAGDNTIYEGVLKRNGVEYRDHEFDGDSIWGVDTIPVGVYELSVFYDAKEVAVFRNIKVSSKCVHRYKFVIDKTVDCDNSADIHVYYPGDTTKPEVTFSLLYGRHDFIPGAKPLNNEALAGAIKFNFFFHTTRYCSQAVSIGGTAGYTHFGKDSVLYEGHPIISKRYTSINFTIGMVNRFSFFNFRNYDMEHTGAYLDVGAFYNLPLIFREVQHVDNNSRLQSRFIHNYLDFYGMLRFGYKYVSVQAEYNPVNCLVKGYTPNPSLRLGLCVVIPLE